jgi:hypothetical protein
MTLKYVLNFGVTSQSIRIEYEYKAKTYDIFDGILN